MIRTLVAILVLTHTARADTCLQRYLGSINVSSSCDEYNCFDGAHINGFDISCTSGVSEAECAEICCSETNCMGFDYSASDHGVASVRYARALLYFLRLTLRWCL